MEKWTNLPNKNMAKVKGTESIQKKEAIATLAYVLSKHSRPMRNLRNF